MGSSSSTSRHRRTSRRCMSSRCFLKCPRRWTSAWWPRMWWTAEQGAAFRNALGSSGGYIFTHSSETLLLNPNAPQMFDDKGNGLFSTVLLDWIEWEGPLVSEAEKSRRKGVVPPDDATPEVVAEHLQRFAERAWRRPVKAEELEQYLQSYRTEREAGEKLADAYRVALQGVLTSRHFIYLVEGDPVARERLTDSELASRLSYFLWSSMPDEALFTAAKGGTLNGDGLKKEVDRMLADSKASRFIDDFARQWLQLHRVGMFPPDKKLYPTYDAWLEDSMRPSRWSSSARCSQEPAHRRLHRFRLDRGQCPALRFLRTAGAEDGRLPACLAEARGSSRRSADDGRGARPDLRRHAPSPGASRRVAQRGRSRQNTASTAGERARHRAQSAHRAPKPPCAENRSPPQRRELRRLPREDRSARPRLGQLRRHRPMAHP
jgi:hypothetical protein